MTLDEFNKSQRKYLKEFKQLIKTNPDEAKVIALKRLQAAGILDKSGNLTKHYR